MKITNINTLEGFKQAIAKCEGDVWLLSQQGDKYNLKSTLSQYIAFGDLLRDQGNQLELYCQFATDEAHFYEFFNKNPEVL